MRLVLINPRDPATCAFSTRLPPLGLGYVAALTPGNWEVVLMDENVQPFVYREADLVALTAMTVQANRAYEIARLYASRGVPAVIGGMHVSMLPDEALRYATAVVVGEAEAAWPRVMRDFEGGRLQGVYRSEVLPDLDGLAVPRRDLFSPRYRLESVQTSRGCPFHCDFCTVPLLSGRRYRFRPVEQVIEELKQTPRRLVAFVDDNIVGPETGSEERAMTLFEGMVRAGIRKRWVSQASVHVARSSPLLKLMKRSGCAGLLVGFESIDASHLREYGKPQNLQRHRVPETFYRDVIRTLHRHGIGVTGFFCYGYEDTRESMSASLRFIRNSGIDVINTPIMIPTPGTRLYDKMLPRIVFRNYPGDWGKYLGRLVFRPVNVTPKEFYKAYIGLISGVNSMGAVLRRTWHCLVWSRSPAEAVVALVTNLMFRKLKVRAVRFLLENDPVFREAYEEWKREGRPDP